MTKNSLRYTSSVTTGTILHVRGAFGHVRRHVAPDGTASVTIVKIDLSNAPGGVPKVIRTTDEALARALASGEARIVARPTPPAPRRSRGPNARPSTPTRLTSAFRQPTRTGATIMEEVRRKAVVERHLLRVDAALRRARRHAGPRGVHDEASARRAMAELRAARILFSGDDLLDARQDASIRRSRRRG